jgi:hypothetical protein
MRIGLIALLVAVAAIVSGSSAGLAKFDTVCDPQGCVSPSKFAVNIYKALNGKVVGYAINVGGFFPYYGGWARTASDPPKTSMGGALRTNVASVSKVLTTIGVLQSLSKHSLTLDSKIWPYVYPDWHEGKNVRTITFRELITHHAGFREYCSGGRTTYAILKEQISNGVNLSDKKKSSYNNCNFAIFRELLPFMEGHPITGTDSARAAKSADFYIDYMNTHVFERIGLGSRACKPYSAPGYPPVLSYPLPADSRRGTTWGDWTLKCGGGGWVLSAQDLFAILVDLIYQHRMLGPENTSELLAPSPNCIAWDCAEGASCPDPYVCKNGALNGNRGEHVHTYIGIFKCTMPVVVIVNSDIPKGIVALVRDAYNAATVRGKGKACSS